MSDINSEVSEIQVESWSKLSRILTHEIMNSLAPVTSLSQTLLDIDRPMDPDVKRGLETISATSRRLVSFVDSYRRFTRIPAPQREPFEVRELIRQAEVLTAASEDALRIRVDIEPADTMITPTRSSWDRLPSICSRMPARRLPDGRMAKSKSARASTRPSTSSSSSATTAGPSLRRLPRTFSPPSTRPSPTVRASG